MNVVGLYGGAKIKFWCKSGEYQARAELGPSLGRGTDRETIRKVGEKRGPSVPACSNPQVDWLDEWMHYQIIDHVSYISIHRMEVSYLSYLQVWERTAQMYVTCILCTRVHMYLHESVMKLEKSGSLMRRVCYCGACAAPIINHSSYHASRTRNVV